MAVLSTLTPLRQPIPMTNGFNASVAVVMIPQVRMLMVITGRMTRAFGLTLSQVWRIAM